ncbi:hypothetical protein COCON_G00203330 [Conger conger]|uniref:2',3'-cyclic-nucleotide 3'-phosphodiesterase n=1 Tax=Conger conger TaxID=82655 RepID=A0A9Q1CZ50_CONCO|nr:hypothetical protein COCON_G00203330 [Conger conger]
MKRYGSYVLVFWSSPSAAEGAAVWHRQMVTVCSGHVYQFQLQPCLAQLFCQLLIPWKLLKAGMAEQEVEPIHKLPDSEEEGQGDQQPQPVSEEPAEMELESEKLAELEPEPEEPAELEPEPEKPAELEPEPEEPAELEPEPEEPAEVELEPEEPEEVELEPEEPEEVEPEPEEPAELEPKEPAEMEPEPEEPAEVEPEPEEPAEVEPEPEEPTELEPEPEEPAELEPEPEESAELEPEPENQQRWNQQVEPGQRWWSPAREPVELEETEEPVEMEPEPEETAVVEPKPGEPVELEAETEEPTEMEPEPEEPAEVEPEPEEPAAVEPKPEEPAELVLEKSAELVLEKSAELGLEKPAELGLEKPAELVLEKPAELVLEKPVEQVLEKPVEQVLEKPVEQVLEKPVEQVLEKPVEQVLEKPVEQVLGKPAEQELGQPATLELEKPLEMESAPVAKEQPEDVGAAAQVQDEPPLVPGSLSFPFLEEESTETFLRGSRTLYVLLGLPGAGKTRLAAAIRERYQDLCAVVSADDHGVKPERAVTWADGHKAMDQAVASCCSAGTPAVVVDDTNHSNDRLAQLGELAEEHRYCALFLEPRTGWSRDLGQLPGKTRRGLDKSQLLPLRASLETFCYPLFYGWFPHHTFRDQLEGLAKDFLKTLDSLEAFKKHISDFTPKGEEVVNLEQYFQHTGPLHCTTKFCDYGNAPGAKEYIESQIVQQRYGSVTELELPALFLTPRTLGVRVALTLEQLQLWPSDAEAGTTLPRGSRGHITLGCAQGVEPVQTGVDLLQILQLQQQGREGEAVGDLEQGQLTYYGDGVWVLTLRESRVGPALFSSFHCRNKLEKKKTPKCTVL